MKILVFFICLILNFATLTKYAYALNCDYENDEVLFQQTCFGEQLLHDYKLIGKFSNGIIDGFAKITFPDEAIYIGGTDQGSLEGYAIKKDSGTTIVGEWRNDIFLKGIVSENNGFLNLTTLDESQQFKGFQGSLFPDQVRIHVGEMDYYQRDFKGLGIAYNLKTSDYGIEGDFELGTFDKGKLIKDYSSEFVKCELNDSGRIISPDKCFADKRTNNMRSVGLFENKKLALGFVIFDNGFLQVGQFKPRNEVYSSELHGVGFFIQSDRMQFELGNFSFGDNDGYTINKDLRRNYTYYGEITNRRKNGFGLEISNDYSEYIGLFENDFPMGFGEKIWIRDKKSYKGNFLIYFWK